MKLTLLSFVCLFSWCRVALCATSAENTWIHCGDLEAVKMAFSSVGMPNWTHTDYYSALGQFQRVQIEGATMDGLVQLRTDSNGRVHYVEFTDFHFESPRTLPASFIDNMALLPELATLKLSGNRWAEPLPSFQVLGSKKLLQLDLHDNGLTMSIDFSNLDTLTWLNLAENNFKYATFDFSWLRNLEWLLMFDAGLTRCPEFTNMSKMTLAYLHGNNLTTIANMSHIPNLYFLHLEDNPRLNCLPQLSPTRNVEWKTSDGAYLADLAAIESGNICGVTQSPTDANRRLLTSLTPSPSYAPEVAGYEYLGLGFCDEGYIGGWEAEDAVNHDSCRDKCNSEPECMYFAIVIGHSCSRYDARAGDCDDSRRPWGRHDHTTWKKLPSDAPTRVPSDAPSDMPTRFPTRAPSDMPSRAPTRGPSDAPTQKPSETPTRFPTRAPSEKPTRVPSRNPSDMPSRKPSAHPTDMPSREPTAYPTDMPTRKPTAHPTHSPTDMPTHLPTPQPTHFPTEFPTPTPTDFPTEFPTPTPSYEPTAFPTPTPSCESTSFPTLSPTTLMPTMSPTMQVGVYSEMGVGFCNRGYMGGWKAEDAVDLLTCKLKCDSEPDCRYFAFIEGRTCSRYDFTAGDCERMGDDHYTFKKVMAPSMQPTVVAVEGYERLGEGHCLHGYIGGWEAEYATSHEACRNKCNQEDICKFFSLRVGKTCSRYDSTAGNCDVRATSTDVDREHETYKKLEIVPSSHPSASPIATQTITHEPTYGVMALEHSVASEMAAMLPAFEQRSSSDDLGDSDASNDSSSRRLLTDLPSEVVTDDGSAVTGSERLTKITNEVTLSSSMGCSLALVGAFAVIACIAVWLKMTNKCCWTKYYHIVEYDGQANEHLNFAGGRNIRRVSAGLERARKMSMDFEMSLQRARASSGAVIV